jgi:hypothetical protein
MAPACGAPVVAPVVAPPVPVVPVVPAVVPVVPPVVPGGFTITLTEAPAPFAIENPEAGTPSSAAPPLHAMIAINGTVLTSAEILIRRSFR